MLTVFLERCKKTPLDQNEKHFCPATPVLRIPVLLLGITAGLLVVTIGCRDDESTTDFDLITTESKPLDQDHFEMALDFLKMRDEHNLERSAKQASYHLNRWIREETADPNWIVDRPMINTLPDAVRRQEVRAAVQSLPERQRRILELRYGFEGQQQPLEAIGRELGITRERVRQLERDALARLARELGDDEELADAA